MPLITLFSAPKPFTDPHIALIQRNALKSWTLLPDVEVILLGEEAGLAEAARELAVQHLPRVACNAAGTPLISSMFQLARENSTSDLLCIINADMLLMPDFVKAAKACSSLLANDRQFTLTGTGAAGVHNFVLLSQRWDFDLTQPLDFSGDWEGRLRAAVRQQNNLHRPAGSDFFLFPRSSYTEIPDFIIGRAGWDNWMIYKARRAGWPVIDCTPSVMIVHQNHDYSHLPGGKPHYDHPDTDANIRLAGGPANVRYTILDATRQLVDGTLIRPPLTSARIARRLELFLRALLFFLPEHLVEKLVRPKRWQKQIRKIFGNR